MKTLKLSTIAFLLLCVFSCKKDASTSASSTVSVDQAADMASGSLAENSNGVATLSDDISANAQTIASVSSGKAVNSIGVSSVSQACGTTLSDSTTFAGTADSVTWNYAKKYTHTLNCNSSEQPDNIVNTLTFTGNYSGPIITSTDAGSANATIAGLEDTSKSFHITGEYKRAGSFTSKVGNKISGNRSVDIVLTSLVLTKPGRVISSGSATISITGTTAKGSFSFTGTIVFNSDHTATLTINGTAYTIDLHTGFCLRR